MVAGFVNVPDPLLNVGKPGRSTDIKTMRDDLLLLSSAIDTLALNTVSSESDIRDDFFGSALNTVNWVDGSDGTGTVTILSEHRLEINSISTGAARAVIGAATSKLRIKKTEEYVAFMNIRVKRTGSDEDTYAFGWQDDALTLASNAFLTDQTDFVGVIHDAGGNWIAISALAGSSQSFGPFATATNWNEIRLEFTCSATAGNRKIEVYLNGALQGTMSDNTKMPTASLRPMAGVFGTIGLSATKMELDWLDFAFKTRPKAA